MSMPFNKKMCFEKIPEIAGSKKNAFRIPVHILARSAVEQSPVMHSAVEQGTASSNNSFEHHFQCPVTQDSDALA